MSGIRRRDFVILLGCGAAAAWPLAARAQQSAGQPLVGLLSPLSAAAWVHILGAFRRGMRDLGYVEGANVAFAFRFADGQVAKLPALANELVALKPAVIAVGSPAAVLETYKATRTIPIVMATSQDPTAVGLAASLARPGGNVTGFWNEGDEALIGKQLDLLKHAVPGIARVGVMVNPDDAADAKPLKALPAAARVLGLAVRVLDVRAVGVKQWARTDVQSLQPFANRGAKGRLEFRRRPHVEDADRQAQSTSGRRQRFE